MITYKQGLPLPQAIEILQESGELFKGDKGDIIDVPSIETPKDSKIRLAIMREAMEKFKKPNEIIK